MYARTLLPTLVIGILLGWLGSSAFSEEEEDPLAWLALTVPGAEHEKLAAMEGTWSVEGEYRLAAGAEAMQTTGTVTRTMILGGRFLRDHFKGTVSDFPVEGIGILGYDRVAKRYQFVWMDTYNTGLWSWQGTAAADGKSLGGTFTGSCPVTNKTGCQADHVFQLIGPDEQVLQTHEKTADGKRFQAMRVTYKRTR